MGWVGSDFVSMVITYDLKFTRLNNLYSTKAVTGTFPLPKVDGKISLIGHILGKKNSLK